LSKVKLGEDYKSLMSNIEIAITLLRIARLRSNLVHSFIPHRRYTPNVQGQRSRSQRNVSAAKTLYGNG